MHASVGSLFYLLVWFSGVCVRSISDGTIQYRLANGLNRYSGRLEVLYNYTWWTVCDVNFDDKAARTVCGNLGLPYVNATTLPMRTFGVGQDRMRVDVVNCLWYPCLHRQWSHNDCTHIVMISCTGNAQLVRLVGGNRNYGILELLQDGNWVSVCSDGLRWKEAMVACETLNLPSGDPRVLSSVSHSGYSGRIGIQAVRCYFGRTQSIIECWRRIYLLLDGEYPCRHAAVLVCEDPKWRLRGRMSAFEGRLEVLYRDEWGTVCDDGFGKEEATVACRTLGLPTKFSKRKDIGLYGTRSGEVWLDNLDCHGNETDLSRCFQKDWGSNNCSHSKDVAISCYETDGTPVRSTRLVGTDGHASNGGTLQVFYNDDWRTVCDAGFGQEEARVACRSLQLPTSIAVRTIRDNPRTRSGRIWLGDLVCTGHENTIFDCDHRYPVGSSDCIHGEDVSVLCGNDYDSTVRLVGAPAPTSGRVEVGYHGEWGTVCSEGFDSLAAKVVCRQLGYSRKNARVILTSDGGGGVDIWIHGTRCTGDESNLFQCPLQASESCDHARDVSVSCESDDWNPSGDVVGTIVGIVVGSVIAIVCITFLVVKCRKRGNTMQRSTNNRADSEQPVYSTQWNGGRTGQISTVLLESPYPVAPPLIPSAQPPSYTELPQGTADLPPNYEDLFFSENSTRTDSDNSAHYTRDVRCLY